MAHVVIEMDRGMGWEVRQEGDSSVTADDLANLLPSYAIQYPHRAFIAGCLVAEARPPHGRRGKVLVVRHDA